MIKGGAMRARLIPALLGAAIIPFAVNPAMAQIAVAAGDAKVELVNGVSKVIANPVPDTVTIIDLKASPPRVIGEVQAPTSVVGPPLSVAITPDEGLALVTAAMKNEGDKQVPDNRMSVIDLKASPPAVIATLETGASPAGLSINRKGDLALVANRAEGTVSVFKISGKNVTPAGKVTIADAKSGVSHVAFAPGGSMALVTRDGDFKISVLAIDGDKVEYTKRDLHAGLRPYGLDISARGDIAVVANIGIGGGDADTISIIDVQAKPPRVVDTMTVGQTPEGIILSPDGSLCAVVVMNGSNKAKESPFYNDEGKVIVYRVSGKGLSKLGEAPIGHWSQGAVFSDDNKTLVVSNMVEKNLQVFSIDGNALKDTGHKIALKGGGAAIRVADKPR
jgi:DNA-binding beta-propeller fold protein YncE